MCLEGGKHKSYYLTGLGPNRSIPCSLAIIEAKPPEQQNWMWNPQLRWPPGSERKTEETCKSTVPAKIVIVHPLPVLVAKESET